MLSLHLYFLARWLLLTWKRLLPTGIRPTRTGNMAPCLYLRSHCTGFCGFHCYCIPCIVSLQHLKVKRVQQTSFFEVKKRTQLAPEIYTIRLAIWAMGRRGAGLEHGWQIWLAVKGILSCIPQLSQFVPLFVFSLSAQGNINFDPGKYAHNLSLTSILFTD